MDLVFSDIHADYDALDTILKIASSQDFIKKYGSYSRIINLGDLLERGTKPKQVLDRLQSLQENYPIFSVMGNHDEGFLYNKKVSGSSLESLDAHSRLTEEDLSFFAQNRDGTYGSQQFIDTKNNLFCVHGGPLDPKKITPKNAFDEAWLYQRSWQRLSQEEFEYFSYYGYHYTPSSAFVEGKTHFNNFIILCGHQHNETAIKQNSEIKEIHSKLKTTQEKISDHIITKREIEIEPSNNYLIRLGIGGPDGNYSPDQRESHFGIIQYDPKKVTLFTIQDR